MKSRALAKTRTGTTYVLPGPSHTQLLGAFAGGVLVGALGLWTAWPASPAPAAQGTSAGEQAAPAAYETPKQRGPERKTVHRPFLTRPEGLFVATDPQRERAYREQQANELIDSLMLRLNAMAGADPDPNPEATASRLHMYQKGLVDGLVRTAPDLTGELADRIERTMCDPTARASHQISLAHMVSDMPELANERTFDCIAARGKEDIVLWSALDAWRSTGMPITAAIKNVEETAKDGRTKDRFMSEADEAALRAQRADEAHRAPATADSPTEETPREEAPGG